MDRNWYRLKVWIIKKRLQGWNVTRICVHAQISRRMFYRWWNRYQLYGWRGLREKPRGRPEKPMDPSLRDRIIRLRKRYEWGPNKIEGYLKHRGVAVPHNQVYKVLCDANLNRPSTKPRRTWGKKRFRRKHPNSLWQTDFKLCGDDYWMTSYQDDHSRFITVSLKHWENPTAEIAINVLEKAMRRYGRPREVLTDQGTQFYDAKGGTTQFMQFLIDNGIKHIVASKRRPTTIGKIEAFHKAYEAESHLFRKHWSFVRYYNYVRPHQELNYLTPAAVYRTKCNPITG